MGVHAKILSNVENSFDIFFFEPFRLERTAVASVVIRTHHTSYAQD
jgi:hypothetical protein